MPTLPNSERQPRATAKAKHENLHRRDLSRKIQVIEMKKSSSQETDNSSIAPVAEEGAKDSAQSVFELALQARNERATRPTTRVTKAPSRIRPTAKIKGWFRSHEVIYGPIDIFNPKDEGGFSDEPVFVMPSLADELRAEGSHFQNAIKEVMGYLVHTMGGALYLVLVPLPDPATGRHHSANEQKIDALEAARREWKRLDWNKDLRQYDDLTAIGMTTEPEWPEDVSELSILTRAFGERNVIKDKDDPLILKFRGEA